MSSPTTNSSSPTRASTDGGRRASQSGMFANLHDYKRGSGDAYQRRRSSVLEQSANKPGFIGGMFDKFVRGSHPASN